MSSNKKNETKSRLESTHCLELDERQLHQKIEMPTFLPAIFRIKFQLIVNFEYSKHLKQFSYTFTRACNRKQIVLSYVVSEPKENAKFSFSAELTDRENGLFIFEHVADKTEN